MPQSSVILPFRPVQEQIDVIASWVHGARRNQEAIAKVAMEVDAHRPASAKNSIAVMNSDFLTQPLSLMVSLEVWQKISGWTLHTSVMCLKGAVRNFEPDLFKLTDRSKSAFSVLSKKQTLPVRIIPVRAGPVASTRLESEEEFDLDLTSVIWYPCTHWQKILDVEGRNIQIACLGERYQDPKKGSLVPVISIHDGVRRIQMRSEDELTGTQRIIGILP